MDAAKDAGVDIEVVETPYLNTIHPDDQGTYPGDLAMEERLHGIIRWNAMMMVTRQQVLRRHWRPHLHLRFRLARLGDGLQPLFRGKDDGSSGDHLYWQGHASPGIYARAWLEGRLTHEHAEKFRQEVGGQGLSSYPHPRLMPDFGSFPPSAWAWVP